MDDLVKFWGKVKSYDYKTAGEKYLAGVTVFAACVSIGIRFLLGIPVLFIMSLPALGTIVREKIEEEINKTKE